MKRKKKTKSGLDVVVEDFGRDLRSIGFCIIGGCLGAVIAYVITRAETKQFMRECRDSVVAFVKKYDNGHSTYELNELKKRGK